MNKQTLAKRTIIEETRDGFTVMGNLYRSLSEAIEAAGPEYTFIPRRRD